MNNLYKKLIAISCGCDCGEKTCTNFKYDLWYRLRYKFFEWKIDNTNYGDRITRRWWRPFEKVGWKLCDGFFNWRKGGFYSKIYWLIRKYIV
jgi:hypothetical protein